MTLAFLVLFAIASACLHAQTPSPANIQNPTETKSTEDPVAPEIAVLTTQITVTATRSAEQVSTIPQTVSILTSETINRTQARTPNQMLREEPGIWSVQVANQGSPIVRGQIGNRVLYLWNGIRINNGAIFSGPNGFFNQIPPGSVERMEVIHGPGAVQYGSDAVGGAINIITRNIHEFVPRVQFGGDLTFRYGSVDLEKSALARVWLAAPRFSLMASYTGQHIDDYKAPQLGRLRNTGFENQGGDMTLSFKVSEKQTARLSFIHDLRWDVATYSQSKLNPSGIPRIFGPFEQRGIAKFGYDVDGLGLWSRLLSLYSYYQYYTAQRDQTVEATATFSRTRTDTRQQVWGGGAQNSASWRKLRFTYGTDYRAESLAADRGLFVTARPSGSLTYSIPNGNVPPGEYLVFDTFALAQAELHPRLSVSLGTRYEHINLKSYPRPQDALTPFTVADLALDKNWNAATWTAGAVYRIAGPLSLRGNIATGFRAPTFSDTLSTGVPVFASGIASVPSPNVSPEKNTSYEVGARLAARKFSASFVVYQNQLRDLLSAVSVGTIAIPGVGLVTARANNNVATGYVRGIEASWAWQPITSFTAFGNITTTRGQDTFRNVPLRFIPPTFGTLGARWSNPKQFWWIETTTFLADRLRRHAPDDELDAGFSRDPGFGSPSATNPPYRPNFELPGFAVANLRAGVDLFKEHKNGTELFINLNNLFNLRYREAYSQQQLLAPGFGLVTGIRYRF